MKISIIYIALLTGLSVDRAAIAYPTTTALASNASQNECFAAGGPCKTLKRAAEAAANAMAEASPHNTGHHQCRVDGAQCFKAKRDECGPLCIKAKRDALALAEAVAEAEAHNSGDHHQCIGDGAQCFKVKRNALAAAEDLVEAEANAGSSVEDGAEANEEICHQVGKPCEVVRRAAKAAAEAIAEANPRHQCFTDGAMCFKAKRALDDLSGVVNSML